MRARIVLVLLVVLPGAALAADTRALNGKAWEAFRARDFAVAEASARAAWRAAEADADARQAGVAAANVAAGLAMRGRFAEALEWSGKSDARLAASGSTKARGRLAAARALIHLADGAREAGQAEFARAETWLGKDDWPLAFVRLTALVYAEPASDTVYKGLAALLKTARAEKDPQRTLRCLLALGWGETFFDPGSSLARYREAHALVAGGTDPELRAYAAHDLGTALFRSRDLGAAEAAFAEGLAEARRSADRPLQVVLLNDLSLLHVQTGEDAAAREEDASAQRVLAGIAEDLRRGRIEDTLLLDFRQLSKLRYLDLPSVLFPLFHGLFDQLALDPETEG
jgi:hypothetical protein